MMKISKSMVGDMAFRMLAAVMMIAAAGPAPLWAQAPAEAPSATVPATPVPPADGVPAPPADAAAAAPAEGHAPALASPAATPDANAPVPVSTPLPIASGQLPEKTPELPHNLSPWGMFLAADIVVKAVMAGLAFASLVTWTVWFAKTSELFWARRRLKGALAAMRESSSLAEASQKVGARDRVTATLIAQALIELRLSSDVLDRPGVLDRIESRLAERSDAVRRAMNRGTGIIATIGATAPFVGLFGTVWGIMNSFIGISKSQTTNLAVVAPGIAEALLATAIGLVAAIPAVIIYNQFARAIGTYKAGVGEAAAEILRHASRDLDRGLKFQPVKAAAE